MVKTSKDDKSVYLDKCDDILPRDPLCSNIKFTQLLLPGCVEASRKGQKLGHYYAIIQPQLLDAVDGEDLEKKIEDTTDSEFEGLMHRIPFIQSLLEGDLPDPQEEDDFQEMRLAIAKYDPKFCGTDLSVNEVVENYQRLIQRFSRQEMKRVLEPLRRAGMIQRSTNSLKQVNENELKQAIKEELKQAIQEALFPNPFQPLRSPFPHIAICVVFEQQWCHKGYTRGERISSIGLAPGEELTLEVHSWTKEHFKSERELAVEAEATLSNRITSRDYLEVASKIAGQANYGSNANLSLTIPVEGIPISIGAGSDISFEVNASLDTTAQKTVEATNEAVYSLKSQRKLRIEEARETGMEEKQLRKVVNTNRCHSVNVHYFEVLSNYQVQLKLVDLVPCVLLKVPQEKVTAEWVLCNEHILKSVLLNKVFLQGFGAAKILETQSILERVQEEVSSNSTPISPSAPTSRHEEEMQRHRTAILTAFRELETNEEDAEDNIADLISCDGNLLCIGTAAGNFLSRFPKLIYSGLLQINVNAYNALQQLNRGASSTPALEAIRNFFTSVTPRDYQYNVVASSIAEALDSIGIPGFIVDALITGNFIDLVDDDCGLFVAVKAAHKRLRDLDAVSQVEDFEEQANAAFQEGAASPIFSEAEAPFSKLVLAEAKVEFNRLKCHIEKHKSHYFNAIWSQTGQSFTRGNLYPQLDCLLQRSPIGFVEDKIAYPISSIGVEILSKRYGVKQLAEIKKDWKSPQPFDISLPTLGMMSEATVGQCCACEKYIEESRLIDIRQQNALATQEEVEAKRRQKRIEDGLLEPFSS